MLFFFFIISNLSAPLSYQYILKASKNSTFTIEPYPRFIALRSLLTNKNSNLWQYMFGADKTVKKR